MVKASRPAATQLVARPSSADRKDRQHHAEDQRFFRGHAARGDRPVLRAAHDGVDIAIVPHVERAEAPAPMAMQTMAMSADERD